MLDLTTTNRPTTRPLDSRVRVTCTRTRRATHANEVHSLVGVLEFVFGLVAGSFALDVVVIRIASLGMATGALGMCIAESCVTTRFRFPNRSDVFHVVHASISITLRLFPMEVSSEDPCEMIKFL